MEENQNVNKELPSRKKAIHSEEHQNKMAVFIEKNYKMLLVIVGLIIIIIFGSMYMSSRNERMSGEASLYLSRVMDYYNSGNYETALNGSKEITIRNEELIGLRKIADDYSGTPSGTVAAFYAGISSEKLSNTEDAKKYYNKALSSESDVVVMGAYAGLGVIHEKENDFEKAANSFLQAAEVAVENESKGRYTYFAGLNYENLGENEKAKDYYMSIVKTMKNTKFVSFAKSGLIRLGIDID